MSMEASVLFHLLGVRDVRQRNKIHPDAVVVTFQTNKRVVHRHRLTCCMHAGMHVMPYLYTQPTDNQLLWNTDSGVLT